MRKLPSDSKITEHGIVKPDTIHAWHCRLVAQKFDSNKQRKSVGRSRVDQELEVLVGRLVDRSYRRGYARRMMSFDPHLFISYAHIDNQPLTPE